MNYLILTETEFFGLINGNDETINLNAAYGCFVKAVVELLSDNDTDGVKIALAYAENELEYHNTQYLAGGVKSHTDLPQSLVFCPQDAKANLHKPLTSATTIYFLSKSSFCCPFCPCIEMDRQCH